MSVCYELEEYVSLLDGKIVSTSTISFKPGEKFLLEMVDHIIKKISNLAIKDVNFFIDDK